MKGSIRRQQDQLHLMTARLDQPSQALQDLTTVTTSYQNYKADNSSITSSSFKQNPQTFAFSLYKKWNLGPAGQGPPASKPEDLSSIPNTHMMEEERTNSCELSSKLHVCTMAGVFIHT